MGPLSTLILPLVTHSAFSASLRGPFLPQCQPPSPPHPSWHSAGPTVPPGLGGGGSSVHLGDSSFKAQAFFCWGTKSGHPECWLEFNLCT